MITRTKTTAAVFAGLLAITGMLAMPGTTEDAPVATSSSMDPSIQEASYHAMTPELGELAIHIEEIARSIKLGNDPSDALEQATGQHALAFDQVWVPGQPLQTENDELVCRGVVSGITGNWFNSCAVMDAWTTTTAASDEAVSNTDWLGLYFAMESPMEDLHAMFSDLTMVEQFELGGQVAVEMGFLGYILHDFLVSQGFDQFTDAQVLEMTEVFTFSHGGVQVTDDTFSVDYQSLEHTGSVTGGHANVGWNSCASCSSGFGVNEDSGALGSYINYEENGLALHAIVVYDEVGAHIFTEDQELGI